MSEEHQQHHHHHHHHHHHQKGDESESNIKANEAAAETTDRGLFDFMGKKEEEKVQEEVMVTEFEKVHVSEPEPKMEEEHKEEEKKQSLLEKLQRSDSSSGSSSEEEVEEGGEKKKKKKKGLKDKISGEKEEENTYIPIEKCDDEVVHAEAEKCDDEVVHAEAMTQAPVEEKKGFLEKIKEKLPGQHKKTEEVYPTPTPPPVECAATEVPVHEGSPKEKKGILEKIKEKLPGYHTKTPEEEKEIPH